MFNVHRMLYIMWLFSSTVLWSKTSRLLKMLYENTSCRIALMPYSFVYNGSRNASWTKRYFRIDIGGPETCSPNCSSNPVIHLTARLWSLCKHCSKVSLHFLLVIKGVWTRCCFNYGDCPTDIYLVNSLQFIYCPERLSFASSRALMHRFYLDLFNE